MMEQRTDEWFAARLGNVTASRIADVMMKPTASGYQNYLAQLVCERLTGQPTETYTSAAMQHGTDTEPQARAFYELATGLDVLEVGYIPHPTLDRVGASPDGLVSDDGLIEIKCPQPATHFRSLTGGAIDRKYLLQMQWQMECTGREWCDFVSFCPSLPGELQMALKTVRRNPEMIAEIMEAVSSFLAAVDQKEQALSAMIGKAA